MSKALGSVCLILNSRDTVVWYFNQLLVVAIWTRLVSVSAVSGRGLLFFVRPLSIRLNGDLVGAFWYAVQYLLEISLLCQL